MTRNPAFRLQDGSYGRQQLLLCVPPGSTIARAIEIIGSSRAVSIHSDRAEAMKVARTSAMESRPMGRTETD